MQPLTHIFGRGLHWLLRFRHRKGYGIHSPFAFSFVTGVVYEKSPFYAYEKLNRLNHSASVLPVRRKDCRLLFRLANFVRPEHCVLQGIPLSDPIVTYLKSGSRHTHYTTALRPAHMIVFGTDWPDSADRLLDYLQEGGMLLLTDVGWTERNREAWQKVLQHPKAQVTFDLCDFGLVFFRPELQRENYIINYL